jgi:hypothetical protein
MLCLRGLRFLAQPLPSHAAHAAHATCPRSALAAAADALLHAKQPTAADWGSLSMATARSAHALPRCRLGAGGRELPPTALPPFPSTTTANRGSRPSIHPSLPPSMNLRGYCLRLDSLSISVPCSIRPSPLLNFTPHHTSPCL